MGPIKKKNNVKKADRLPALIEKIDAMRNLKEMIGPLTKELDDYKSAVKKEMDDLGYEPSRTAEDGTKTPGDKLVATACIAQLVGGRTAGKIDPVLLLQAGVSTTVIERCTTKGKPTISLRLDAIK